MTNPQLPALPETFHPGASHIHPDYRDGWNACHAAFSAALASQAAGQPAASAVPEGFHLVAVNEGFEDLVYWLDRCHDKGKLDNCYDLVERWPKFDYRNISSLTAPVVTQQAAAPQPAEQQHVATAAGSST